VDRVVIFNSGGDGELLNCPEHYDSGLITILSQDEVGGLQVQRPSDKAWIDVKPDPDTIVINTGTTLVNWLGFRLGLRTKMSENNSITNLRSGNGDYFKWRVAGNTSSCKVHKRSRTRFHPMVRGSKS